MSIPHQAKVDAWTLSGFADYTTDKALGACRRCQRSAPRCTSGASTRACWWCSLTRTAMNRHAHTCFTVLTGPLADASACYGTRPKEDKKEEKKIVLLQCPEEFALCCSVAAMSMSLADPHSCWPWQVLAALIMWIVLGLRTPGGADRRDGAGRTLGGQRCGRCACHPPGGGHRAPGGRGGARRAVP